MKRILAFASASLVVFGAAPALAQTSETAESTSGGASRNGRSSCRRGGDLPTDRDPIWFLTEQDRVINQYAAR